MPARRAARAGDSTERERAVRRRRLAAALLLLLGCTAIALSVALASPRHHANSGARTSALAIRAPTLKPAHRAGNGNHGRVPTGAVGLRVLTLVDTSRTAELPNGAREPRTLVTYVRYPALGPSTATDVRNAAPASTEGPFPLVVFGHGFAVTPALYTRLLVHWARAGYVVAAPVFPRENADAPEGPDESDLVNQPKDMSFVISQLLALNARSSSPLAGLIAPEEIAVSGQSDGGDTALAVAYDTQYRDRRVKAAVILSGAEIPGTSGFAFPPGSPPLLATQGTADTVNRPSETNAFFEAAQRPKYLLTLIGAGHLPPYSDQEPQLSIVDGVTTAFLDAYLKHEKEAVPRLAKLGDVSGIASLHAEP